MSRRSLPGCMRLFSIRKPQTCQRTARFSPHESFETLWRAGGRFQLLTRDFQLLTVDCLTSLRLRQQNDEFELGVGDVAGDVGANVAGPLHGFPGGPGLIEAEILIVELNRDRPRRRRDVS